MGTTVIRAGGTVRIVITSDAELEARVYDLDERVTALENGGVTPTPSPSFSTQPVVSPSNGTTGQTFTATPGTVSNGSITSRVWLLNGTSISTGLTAVPGIAGTLTYRETATGPGGTTQSALQTVTVTSAAITRIIIAGDSITSIIPNQPDNHNDFYSHSWADAHPDLTISVSAQASRTVGGPAFGDPSGADVQSNSLLANRSSDMAFGAQLLTVMIGANDFGTFAANTVIQRLIEWAVPIRAAGTKIAWSVPTPYRSTAPLQPNYTAYMSRRADFIAACEDPAVWGQWADYRIPMGEHPDFTDPATVTIVFGPDDGVHPRPPVTDTTSGQAKLFAVFDSAMRSLLDISRTNSTMMFDEAWPQGGSNLATSTQIVRRFIVSGIAHKGLSSGVTVTGGAQVRVGGGAWGTSTGSILNGSVVDIRITTSSSNATAVSTNVTIGSETRTLTFTTVAAVTPASYAHGGFDSLEPGFGSNVTHTYEAKAFPAGIPIVGVNAYAGVPTGVTIGGVAATKLVSRANSGATSVWTVPAVPAGNRDVVLTFSGGSSISLITFGALQNADPTPTQTDAVSGGPGSPFQSSTLTLPGSGIDLTWMGMYGGVSAVAGSVTSGTGNTQIVSQFGNAFNGEKLGLILSSRTVTGKADNQYGQFQQEPMSSVVFKAAGS